MTITVPLILEPDEQEGFHPVRLEGDVADAADAYFREMVFNHLGDAGARAWIAGGVLRSWIETRRVDHGSDIDVWATSPEHAQELADAAKKAGWKEKKHTDTSFNFETKEGKLWVQIIRAHHFRTAVKTIQSFDFTVCALALSPVRGFIMHPATLLDMAMRRLVVIDLQFPRSTLLRTFKYRDKGYKICTGELEKVVQELTKTVMREHLAEHRGEEPETRPFQSPGNYPWRGLD